MAFRHDLRPIDTRAALLNFLSIDGDVLDAVLNFSTDEAAGTGLSIDNGDLTVSPTWPFIRHDIPKRNSARGERTVWEATSGLALVYKALARKLESFFRDRMDGYPHDSAYGYRVGRNIRENAAVHAGNRNLLVADIADFFPSISTGRIEQHLRDLGLSEEVAGLLSRFVTIDGALPPGLATSPPISNAIVLPVDVALKTLSDSVGAAYTRYADDLSFSGDGALPDIEDIRRILAAERFQIADAKTRRSRIGQAHFVTGLSISDPVRPHVPQRKKRRLRQELYYAGKFGLDSHFDQIGVHDHHQIQREVNRLDGLIKFVAHHEPLIAAGLKSQWREILRESGMGPSFEPRNQHRPPFHIYIDEAEYVRDGVQILALGMSASQHQDRIAEDSRRLLQETTSDIYGAGKLDVIRAKGLHYADATEDLRLAYVKQLAAMPFEGYVAFDRCDDPSNYQAVYIRLLKAMITRRLMAAESQAALIVVEKNSKVSEKAVEACIEAAYMDLARRNDRRPRRIGVKFVSKPNLGIAVPDFLLGVLGKYLQPSPKNSSKNPRRDHQMFERLRDKYRLILDLAEGVEYSRRRPIEPWG